MAVRDELVFGMSWRILLRSSQDVECRLRRRRMKILLGCKSPIYRRQLHQRKGDALR